MMDEATRIALRAAALKLVANQYRGRARQGAPEQWSLELQASALDALAVGLFSVGAARLVSEGTTSS